MVKWKKKNGNIVETNEEEANISIAVKLGWEQVKPVKARKVKE